MKQIYHTNARTNLHIRSCYVSQGCSYFFLKNQKYEKIATVDSIINAIQEKKLNFKAPKQLFYDNFV